MLFQDRAIFKTGTRWLIGAAAIALLGTGATLAYLFWLNRSSEPLPVRVVTVTRDNVEDTINASGTVELGNQQTLKSPAEGAVDQVFVQPGDFVEAGQVLIVLRNAERQTAIADQRLKIEQQQEILERNRQKIREAEEQLTAYREDLRLLSSLLNEGAIARTEVRDKEDQIRRTEVELREAEAESQKAFLELERLQVENQTIQQQLQETLISSPINGVVLEVNVNDGDGVEVRTDLLTLGNPAQEIIQLQLSPLEATRIKVGQQTRVSMIGPSSENFSGRVISVSPLATVPSSAESKSSGSDRSGQAVVATIVRLDQPSGTLIPGSQVNVEIVLNSRENVMVLGTEAIQRAGPEPFVWIVNEQGQAQKRPVQLGLEGLTTVEVVDGLRSGDQIILPSPDAALTPNMPVVPE